MNKALENQNYKTIWEAVIKNRHPEVKSLEEALESEKEHPDCLVSIENGYILQSIGELSINAKLIEFNRKKIQYSYIGRPIRLEDILALFNKFQKDETITIIHIDISYSNIIIVVDKENKSVVITLKLTKPLHEQTPETWEAIVKLI